MTGPHVTEELSAYMDGELGAPEREAVAAHLRSCPTCARHLEELRAVDSAARDLPLAVPDGYFEAFRGSLRQRLQRVPPRPVRRRVAPVWIGAAAAAVVLALLTPRLLVRDSRARVPPAAPVPTQAERVSEPTPPAAPAKTDSTVAHTETRMRRAEAPPPVGSGQGRLAEGTRPQAPPAAATPQPAQEQARNAAVAPKAGYAAPPPAEMDEVQGTLSKAAPPASKMEAETDAAGRDEEAKARRDKRALGALQDRAAPADAGAERFQVLARRTVASAAEARALRDAWRTLARDEGAGPRADEARVRAVEAGIEAWRISGDEKAREEALKDGRAYLERPDALQPDRIRDALRPLAR